MEQALKILLLEDSYTDAEIIKRLVKKGKPGCDFLLATNKNDFLKALDDFSPDVIISDNSLPQFDATEALQIVRDRSIHVPFILVTGTVSEEFAAGIMKQGADDYILKDRMIRLPNAIDTALKQRKALKEIADYKYALDQSAIIAITDQKGIIVYANDNFCKISKYSKEELIGQDHRIINSGYHPKSYIKELWRTIANGEIWKGEFRNKAKDGTLYWVETTIVPFLNEQGKPYQYLSIRIDITEQKKTEEKIQKSEEQYRDLVENITDLICTHDLDGRILSVNRAAEELMGQKFNPKDNLNIKDLLVTEKKDEFDLYIANIKKNGYAEGLMKVKTFSGKIHIWEYKNSLKTTGVTPIVRGYARDITESRIAEENLRKSEARLKEAQAITHISNWEIDLVQNSHTWSEEFYRIYGINKSEVQPSAELFLSFMHPEDAAFAEKKIQEAFKTLKNSSFNFRFIRKDGIIRHGYTEWRFEFDKKRNPLRLYGIVQDITERKQAEEERKRLELKLMEQQRKEQVIITATTLEAQERERNAIGVELHDNVNQILVGTKILLSTIKNTSDKEKNLVASCIKNLQEAIDENRKISHALVTPDLETDTLVDQINRLTHGMLETAGLSVHTDTSSYNEALLDKEKKIAIYRIGQEQCTNIVKYAKAQHVNISLSTANNVFKMIIADDGLGMKEGKKTAGIGLRNINSRLSIFNGKANTITAPGKGFTLEIEIPYWSD